MALNIVGSSDGRRQRSERSQTAIIEAALALMEEGTLVPTAQQIADRAPLQRRAPHPDRAALLALLPCKRRIAAPKE